MKQFLCLFLIIITLGMLLVGCTERYDIPASVDTASEINRWSEKTAKEFMEKHPNATITGVEAEFSPPAVVIHYNEADNSVAIIIVIFILFVLILIIYYLNKKDKTKENNNNNNSNNNNEESDY